MSVPIRTCIGCGQKRPKEELLRLVVRDDLPRTDPRQQASGRGAYLCGAGCLKAAWKRKAFARAFRGRMRALELAELEQALAAGGALR